MSESLALTGKVLNRLEVPLRRRALQTEERGWGEQWRENKSPIHQGAMQTLQSTEILANSFDDTNVTDDVTGGGTPSSCASLHIGSCVFYVLGSIPFGCSAVDASGPLPPPAFVSTPFWGSSYLPRCLEAPRHASNTSCVVHAPKDRLSWSTKQTHTRAHAPYDDVVVAVIYPTELLNPYFGESAAETFKPTYPFSRNEQAKKRPHVLEVRSNHSPTALSSCECRCESAAPAPALRLLLPCGCRKIR